MLEVDCKTTGTVSFDLPDSIDSVVLFSVAQQARNRRGLDGNEADAPEESALDWHTSVLASEIAELEKFQRPIKVNVLVPAGTEEDAKQLELSLREGHPEVQFHCESEPIDNPKDYCQVYQAIYKWLNSYPWVPGKEEYFGNISNGTAPFNSCMMQMMGTRMLPGDAVQVASGGAPQIIDLRQIQLAIARTFAPPPDNDWLLGRVLPEWSIASTSIEKILETLTVVVKTVDDPILILGDTGVGKTRLAKMIHDIHGGPFKAANCATIRGDTAKSELFGHARGAYTGSSGERKGLLLEANKGVLFLDEIGELGLEEQGMLLKAIEEGKFSPMGGDNLVKSTFGLVAGTNRNLDMAVLQGRFRRDLLARISVWKFRLPGLGESKEGIPTAINDALQEFCTNNKMERVVRFDVNAEKSFYEFAVSEEAIWPGNFRELRSSVRRMATMAQDGIISQDIIHQELGRLQSEWSIHQQNKREIDPGIDHVASSVVHDESRHANLLALIPDARSRWDQAELDYADQLITTCLQAKSQAQAARLFFPVKLKLMPVGEKKLNPTNMIVRELEKYDLSWKSLDPLRSVP